NGVGRQLDDLSSQRRALFVAQAEAACHDCQVLTLDESQQAQLIEERGYHRRVAQLTDHDTEAIDMARPLRARRSGPRYRRAAEKRDELAPPHGPCLRCEDYTLPDQAALCSTAKLAAQCRRWVKSRHSSDVCCTTVLPPKADLRSAG